MSKEVIERIIPNEVILVGKLRDEADKALIITTGADGKPIANAELLKAVLTKYKFTRDTAPSANAIEAGFLSGKFYQIQMGDPGGEMFTLANGKIVRRSRKTTDPGFTTIFASNRATTFEEIKEELLHKDSNGNPDRIESVGGDPNNGKLRLKEYALMGFWDMFPLGFHYKIHQRNKAGVLEPFISKKKQDDGTFKPEQAISNSGRHFVFEDEVHNLEGLRDAMREQVSKWKIEAPKDNTQPEKGVIDNSAPIVEKKVATTDEP